MSESDELARLMAFAQRSRHDCSRDAAHFWENTFGETREQWLRSADAIIAAGYRRIPEPDSAEEAKAVERMAKAMHDAVPLGYLRDALRAALHPKQEPRDG